MVEEEHAAAAREIIDANLYMVLATADAGPSRAKSLRATARPALPSFPAAHGRTAPVSGR
jgi:hypothetical protein